MTIRHLLIATFAATSLASHADVLLQYDFETTPGGSTGTASPTTEATDVTGSAFTVLDNDDNALEFSTFASDTSQRSVFEFTGGTSPTSITVDTAPYWSFTVTSAERLDLEDLRFAIGRGGSGSFTASYNVSSSVDGHASLLAGSNFTYSAANDEMSAPANQVVDLTGSSFQNLDASSGVTFRIYYADDSTINSTGGRIDTVSLNGAVIPEPSSLVLAAIGMVGVLAVTRRRRRR